ELAVFSLLWSEHCGYKHSALLLKRLPSEGERVLQGPGENAGVLDLGDGLAVAFKVESHNHPSAVEPFQGAATGVGGIIRDIVAMGARPVALLDGLRFGEPGHEFSRAVGGIGAYGNSVGVATVGGEVVFDEAYRDNCLVNAMCVGLLPSERLMQAKATGSGHSVVLYGATTGRDGIGGASVLASQELDDGAEEKRPSVQIGDPFTGKKLIEASIELVQAGLVESLQDCGAVPPAGELSDRDTALLAAVEAGFERVGEPLARARFKASISEAMRLAALVNQYLGEEQPWHLVKTDRERAGTVLHVALQCVNHLKVMFTPFLPFSSQRLHELLGFDDTLAPMPSVTTVEEGAWGSHRVIGGDYATAPRWRPERLPAGHPLRPPVALYKKLDDSLVDDELRRMEGAGGE
ncbi:MAG: AIR synthase related protein, partial [Chloroflexota bacterium]